MPRRTNYLRTDELIHLCGGDITLVAELERHGLNRNVIAYRCRSGGPWRRLLPGVVMLRNGPPTRADRRRAALLYAGEHAVLTSLDALDVHGMRKMPRPSGPVHVLLPADRRRVGAAWVLPERTERLPATDSQLGPAAPLPRAALDFARRSGDRDQVRATIAEVVQRGYCCPVDLVSELAAGSGRGTALPRAVLQEISDGVRSVAEANARKVAQRSGLAPPMWNARLFDTEGRFIGMPDAWFDDVGLVWEIDSYEYHLSPVDYARTLDRRSALMAEGIVVMHTQPSKLDSREAKVLDELCRTHGQAALRPRPPIVAVPAT